MDLYCHWNEYSQISFATSFQNTKVVHVVPKTKHKSDSLDKFYLDLAQQVGVPLIYEEDPVSGEIKPNQWTEIKFDQTKVNESYKHSNKYQPLHTDYGYFSFEIYCSFFYCKEQADFGGATTFFDSRKLTELLYQHQATLYEGLLNRKIQFDRGNNPLVSNDDFVLQKEEDDWKVNWNYYRAQKDTENSEMVNNFKKFLDEYIEKSGELLEIKLQPGEGVFFHDRLLLHGRNSFFGHRHLNKGGVARSIPDEVQKALKEL